MRKRIRQLAVLCLPLVAGIWPRARGDAAMEPFHPAPVQFVDAAERLGLRFRHAASWTSQAFIMETMSSGVALFDFDNDGRLDVFFTNGAAVPDKPAPGEMPRKTEARYWNRLFHQLPDGTFEDVTERAGLAGEGYSMGVAVGDYDNDGFEDLLVTGYDRLHLYHNNGNGTFTDVTAAAGLTATGDLFSSAAFVDYDNDGKLDLVALRYLRWDLSNPTRCRIRDRNAYCDPKMFDLTSLVLYHNDGNGKFSNATAKSGLAKVKIKGLGVDIGDYDRDGWIDLVVANDGVPQSLLRNRHDGTFEDVGMESLVAVDADGNTYAGMGVQLEDYDNDGWPDLLIDDLSRQRYALFRNRGDGTFDYTSSSSGIRQLSALYSGWGLRMADFNNDGWKDIFVAQGHVNPSIAEALPSVTYLEPPLLALNNGKGFEDAGASAGAPFREKWAARGAAVGDINNDGFLDIVVSTNDGPAHLLMNQGNSNKWISLKLVGTKSNRDGIGAVVRIATPDGLKQYQTVKTSGSYLSASDVRVHFGLNQQPKVSEVEIRWPSGLVQKLADLPANHGFTICETAAADYRPAPQTPQVAAACVQH